MKKSRFTEEQMVTSLREADEKPGWQRSTASARRPSTALGSISAREPADVKRLPQLEHENNRLKRLVADRNLEL